MKGVNIILQAIMIFGIALAAVFVVVPWTINIVERSSEGSEPGTILQELRDCNQKITETARTGNGNVCYFSVKSGKMKIKSDGIYYTLSSNSNFLCDEHVTVTIDEENHIVQSCDVWMDRRTLELKWYWPQEVSIGSSNLGGNIGVSHTNSICGI